MSARSFRELTNPIPNRVRLGALSAVLALSAIIMTGCSSTHHAVPAGAVTASAAQSAAGEASRSANGGPNAPSSTTDDAAAVNGVCQVISLNADVLTKAATPNDPSVDRAIAHLRQLRDTAPPEISADIQVVADFDQKLITANRGGSPGPIPETPELTTAVTHLGHWIAAHCPH